MVYSRPRNSNLIQIFGCPTSNFICFSFFTLVSVSIRNRESIVIARDGTVVRALASHQCGTGSTPGVDAICGLSLFLVLSFAPRGFSSGTPVFPSPQKPTFPNSNSTRNQVDEELLCGCATCKSLFIHLFIYLPQSSLN